MARTNQISVMFLISFVGFSTLTYLEFEQLNRNQQELEHHVSVIRGSIDYTDYVDSNTTGTYNPRNDNIYIYIKGRKMDSVYQTFLHEWGHHIWYEEIDQDIRNEFCNLTFVENVSKYASTNCRENFAETYAYWYQDKEVPEPQLSWMKKNIAEWGN